MSMETCVITGLRTTKCLRKQLSRFTVYSHDCRTGRVVRWKSWSAWNKWSLKVYREFFSTGHFWEAYWEGIEMKRRAKAEQAKKGKYERHGEPLMRNRPSIERYLWDAWYDDGSPREVSKLTVCLTPGAVQLSLTDPGERSTAFVTAPTVEEALDLLEGALNGPGDPWRPWPKGFGKK